ncbi:hypothetical protein [Pseudalkalibacillus salsuginis]|uniref:hypothetical protein n=1 Tax=Pseudalkalibacillus salsuginis TaxID=2910972 RepID=UPI001F1B0A93|nr:hypothetical protein [Pseudalkalibacillus salsuginis]MCF6409440.1 hypothetical protein [Pseudalkalibacillus salsuginis]
MPSIHKDVQKFIDQVDEQNGVHLFFDKKEAVYVFLNAANMDQGEEAAYIKNFTVKCEGDTLEIYYAEKGTRDYSNNQLDHQLLYKINLDKYYEKIVAFSNEKEVPFAVASGN